MNSRLTRHVWIKRLLCISLILSLTLPAAIPDDFGSGNRAGDSGWLGPWSAGTVTNIPPIGDGDNHLLLTGLTGSSGVVRQWREAPHLGIPRRESIGKLRDVINEATLILK
jgi:hypothetical protein